jgi:hypothetical protein
MVIITMNAFFPFEMALFFRHQILKIFRQTDVAVLDQCCPAPKISSLGDCDSKLSVHNYQILFIITFSPEVFQLFLKLSLNAQKI